MSKRNFYEILNATTNASFDDLKRNYKQLILQCHPDKLQNKTTNSANDENDPNGSAYDREFIMINEAWNTLKDATKRKLYDAELLSTIFQTHSNVYERITLAAMERCVEEIDQDDDDVEDNHTEAKTKRKILSTFYTYNCRCGGQYIVDESADNEIFNKRRTDNDKNACGYDSVGTADGDGVEVIVECNECSLVIILNG